jgi:hypothetical protein
MQRSKDADAHNPSETAFSNVSEILVHRGGGGGGVYIKWNGPLHIPTHNIKHSYMHMHTIHSFNNYVTTGIR